MAANTVDGSAAIEDRSAATEDMSTQTVIGIGHFVAGCASTRWAEIMQKPQICVGNARAQ